MSELEFRGQLEEIERSECLALIATKQVGRLAFCTDRGAMVVPVNHAFIAGELVIRVSPSGETATYLHDHGQQADVTYEVDDLDEAMESGWSVVVTGTAHATPPEMLTSPEDRPVPWPAGSYWQYVRIRPLRVTGRRLAPV
jgi:nitroimidazol reductase NimA-like FMN-containing flavoprotein (pyridoxamine 5'-phosphate oxidase superfamily)